MMNAHSIFGGAGPASDEVQFRAHCKGSFDVQVDRGDPCFALFRLFVPFEHPNMKRAFKFLGVIGLFAHSLAFAEQSPGDDVNPVELASFHQLVFADEDLAILNNLYPPKGDSGFHAHHRDLFAVIIEPSPSSGQGLGKPLTAAPPFTAGAVAFSSVGAEPRIHRVVNNGEGIFHIMVVELRLAEPLKTPISSRDAASVYAQVFDNPRLRAWRLVLEPGQAAASITQGNKGVRVVVRGGLLTTVTPDRQDQTLFLQPGDVALQPAGVTRALKNTGTETIELVELELK